VHHSKKDIEVEILIIHEVSKLTLDKIILVFISKNDKKKKEVKV